MTIDKNPHIGGTLNTEPSTSTLHNTKEPIMSDTGKFYTIVNGELKEREVEEIGAPIDCLFCNAYHMTQTELNACNQAFLKDQENIMDAAANQYDNRCKGFTKKGDRCKNSLNCSIHKEANSMPIIIPNIGVTPNKEATMPTLDNKEEKMNNTWRNSPIYIEEIPRYGRKSLADFVGHGEPTYYTVDLGGIEADLRDDLMQVIDDKTNMLSWVKGTKVTMVNAVDGDDFTDYLALFDALGIEVINGPKTPKRISRAFSLRDAISKWDEFNIVVVDNDEFTRAVDYTDEEAERFLDGCAAWSRSSFIMWCKENNIKAKRAKKAKAVSLTVLGPLGMVKVLAYIVDDAKMVVQGADLICSAPNIKLNMLTKGEFYYVIGDLSMPYGDPMTNTQLEVNIGRMLFDAAGDALCEPMRDKLTEAFKHISDGTVYPHWEEMLLRDRAYLVNENQDYRFLMGAPAEAVARGLDYRWFPSMVSRLATSVANEYYDQQGDWHKFPIMCAKYVPVITESAAVLIGEDIDVEAGDYRHIRHGSIVVTNDVEYARKLYLNGGGSDLDDMFVEIQRTIDNIKKGMLYRIPAGLGEFTILNFVEGDDEAIVWTDRKGNDIKFPVMPGKLMEDLATGLENGNRKITGMGDIVTPELDAAYNVNTVLGTVSELLDSAAFVGSVMNPYMVATAVMPELLAEVPALPETIIDTFTQGGAQDAREKMVEWSKGLIKAMVKSATKPVDPKLWAARTPMYTSDPKVGFNVNGFFNRMYFDNKDMRVAFTRKLADKAQDQAKNGNPALDQALAVFGLTRDEVATSRIHTINKARGIAKNFNTKMQAMRSHGKITQEDWTHIYTWVAKQVQIEVDRNNLMSVDLPLALYVVAMSIPNTKGNYNDQVIINTYMWPMLIEAFAFYGIAFKVRVSDTGRAMPEIVNGWKLTCPTCGLEHITAKANVVFKAHENKGLCKTCR